MTSWQTRFTKQFPCSVPIMGAPMAGVSGGRLAYETNRAGALGSIAAGHFNTASVVENVEKEVRLLREAEGSPLVVGFIGHSTFKSETGWKLVEEFMSRHKPEAVQYFAPAVMKRPSDGQTSNIDLAHKHGCKVITQVGTEAHAIEALAAGTDCIVAQGSEAGGHGCRPEVGSGTIALAARIVSVVRSNEEWHDTPVLAAGGIVDGRGLVAALALGCDGVVLGTRLWASHEGKGLVSYKERLADSNIGPDEVIRTQVMDGIQNSYTPNPWPEPFDSSGLIRNSTIDTWHGDYDKFKEAIKDGSIVQSFKDDNGEKGEATNACVFSGKGVGDITSIDNAYDIIRRVDDDAASIIQNDLAKLVQ